jgi:hypothetical protein
VKKKRKKRDRVPLLQQKWFQATAIILALAGIGFGVYLAVRPASPEKLFVAVRNVRERIDQGDEVAARDKVEAAERYLHAYADRPGEMTDAATALFREGKVQERETQLTNRFRNNMQKPEPEDDPDAYTAAWQAMAAEKAGNLKDAAEWWAKVKGRFPQEAELRYTADGAALAKARWGWVAEKRLADLQEAAHKTGELKAEIQNNRNYEVAMPYDATRPKGLAVRAFRADEFGDKDRAARTWEALRSLVEKKPAEHVWYLIACQQLATIPPSVAEGAPAKRVSHIRETLQAAESLALKVKGDPEKGVERAKVRELCREVIELYEDDQAAEVVPLVARAKQIMAAVPKTS